MELIVSLFWGTAAYLLYVQFLGMVCAYTVDIFRMVLGLAVSRYHLSRPLLLCAGFMLTQGYYLFVHFDFGYSLPVYVELIRAVLITILLIIFTKVGCVIKKKMKEKLSGVRSGR